MNLHCCTTDQKLWQQHVLSVSDEAFPVLVLLKYSRRWCVEKMRDIQKVGANDDQLLLLNSLNKDSHHHKVRYCEFDFLNVSVTLQSKLAMTFDIQILA